MNRSRFLLPYNIWIVCDRSQRERNVTWFRSSHVKGVDGLLGESRYYRLVSSNVSSGSVVLAGTSKREERKQGEARELAKIIRRREEKSRRKGGTLKYFKAKRRAEKSRRTWMKKRGSARKVQHFPRPPFFASFKNDELSRVMQWNAISSLQSSLDQSDLSRSDRPICSILLSCDLRDWRNFVFRLQSFCHGYRGEIHVRSAAKHERRVSTFDYIEKQRFPRCDFAFPLFISVIGDRSGEGEETSTGK